MITEDDHCGPIRELLEPPAETIDEFRSNSLGLGMNDISTDHDEVRTEIVELLEKILEYLGVFIMTLQATPVDISNVRDLDQRMLPLLMILERLIIP